MQAGELIVVGKNEAKILLHKFPYDVKVHFRDQFCETPCNPHHADVLEWEVQSSIHHHGGFVLIIKWNVENVREIEWKVFY